VAPSPAHVFVTNLPLHTEERIVLDQLLKLKVATPNPVQSTEVLENLTSGVNVQKPVEVVVSPAHVFVTNLPLLTEERIVLDQLLKLKLATPNPVQSTEVLENLESGVTVQKPVEVVVSSAHVFVTILPLLTEERNVLDQLLKLQVATPNPAQSMEICQRGANLQHVQNRYGTAAMEHGTAHENVTTQPRCTVETIVRESILMKKYVSQSRVQIRSL